MRLFLLSLFSMTLSITFFPWISPAHADTRGFHEAAVKINGAKFWLPSTLTVKKGDTVKILAVSKIQGAGSVHGFAIDAVKVQEIVDKKGETIEFVADKAGIFPFRCQLHAAHIGGQLIVEP